MTKSIVRVNKTSNYVVMDKGFLNDKNLSLKAKGLLAYMLSLPDDWMFYLEELEKHSTDGMSSLRSGFRELQDNGYVTRKRERQDDGTFKWLTTVHETTTCENPQVDNPHMENPQVDNRKLLSNDVLNNKELSSSNAHSFYQNNFGMLTPFIAENINQWIDDLNEPLVIAALERAAKQNKQFNYAEGILKDWYRNNIRTLDDVEAKENQFTNKRKTKNKDKEWADF